MRDAVVEDGSGYLLVPWNPELWFSGTSKKSAIAFMTVLVCSHKSNMHLYGWRMGLRSRRRVHYIYIVGIVCYYQSREAWHSGWRGDEGTVLPNVRHFS